MYEDNEEDEYDLSKQLHEILNTMILPRIETVVEGIKEEYPNIDKRDFSEKLHARLFNEEVIKQLKDIGIEDNELSDIEINIFSVDLDENVESIVDQISLIEDEEDKQEYIMDFIENKDRYLIETSEYSGLTMNTYEVKPRISLDDIDPISEDEFNKMLGTGL